MRTPGIIPFTVMCMRYLLPGLRCQVSGISQEPGVSVQVSELIEPKLRRVRC